MYSGATLLYSIKLSGKAAQVKHDTFFRRNIEQSRPEFDGVYEDIIV